VADRFCINLWAMSKRALQREHPGGGPPTEAAACQPRIQYLTTDGYAVLRHCQPQTVRLERSKGGGPPYIKVAGRVLYDINDVVAFLDAHKVTSTSEEQARRRRP